MIDATQAQAIVLRHCEGGRPCADSERFAVQSCEFSERGNCWIVRANSEDYVLHDRVERCYVGVNAYLVDRQSGSLEIVGSGQSVEQYLQDKDDLRSAGNCSYVLEPTFDQTGKFEVIRFRQALECSLHFALQMIAPQNRGWLTGKLRVLKDAQALLERRGVPTKIGLQQSSVGAVEVDDRAWHWQALKAALKSKEGRFT